ncbi:hypothetical protein [Actinoplanes sp. NPDC020271]|uniref:hypothetical protein n=1 Tax=Actinoplanes sp. NPDC020271 TaxID=3363896 RepID=UPI0037905B99
MQLLQTLNIACAGGVPYPSLRTRDARPLREFRVFANVQVRLSILITISGFGGMFGACPGGLTARYDADARPAGRPGRRRASLFGPQTTLTPSRGLGSWHYRERAACGRTPRLGEKELASGRRERQRGETSAGRPVRAAGTAWNSERVKIELGHAVVAADLGR